ncbi:unnamed protein product [Diplocarpon coronariae]
MSSRVGVKLGEVVTGKPARVSPDNIFFTSSYTGLQDLPLEPPDACTIADRQHPRRSTVSLKREKRRRDYVRLGAIPASSETPSRALRITTGAGLTAWRNVPGANAYASVAACFLHAWRASPDPSHPTLSAPRRFPDIEARPQEACE